MAATHSQRRLLARIAARKEWVLKRLTQIENRIKQGKVSEFISEDKLWLDSRVRGVSLEVCCGDVPVLGVVGVDTDSRQLGVDLLTSGDNLTATESCSIDVVLCDYLEVFPCTLKALHEWHRVLCVGGELALVCRDAYSYTSLSGALQNRHLVNTFTRVTIRHYLHRAGFVEVEVEPRDNTLRITAKKV